MDRQTQNWLKDRQRQKEEARLAREVIKAKLEQDKLERQAQQRNAGQSWHKMINCGPALLPCGCMRSKGQVIGSIRLVVFFVVLTSKQPDLEF